jgi:hypothetical protein
MATIDLFQLVFEVILKISPNLLYKYTTIQDQILNLIFFPHVVLFLFILGFGDFLVPEGRSTGRNRGMRYLVMAAAYIFIVYQGWYGTILIPLMQTWFTIMLVSGLAFFFIARIFSPKQADRLGTGLATYAGTKVGQSLGKPKALAALQRELDDTKKQLAKNHNRLHDPSYHHNNPYTMAALNAERKQLEDKVKRIEREIKKY